MHSSLSTRSLHMRRIWWSCIHNFFNFKYIHVATWQIRVTDWDSNRSEAGIPHSGSSYYVHLPHLLLGKPPDPQTSLAQTLTVCNLSESCTTNSRFSTGGHPSGDIGCTHQPFPLCDQFSACDIRSTVECCSVVVQHLRKHKTALEEVQQ